MWCLLCYEPVRQLTPREPPRPTNAVFEPASSPLKSRWRKGPTTFGPVGRLAITAVVLAFAPWGGLTGFGSAAGPLTLWWLLGWSVTAPVVLRHVWRKEEPIDDSPGTLDDVRARVQA